MRMNSKSNSTSRPCLEVQEKKSPNFSELSLLRHQTRGEHVKTLTTRCSLFHKVQLPSRHLEFNRLLFCSCEQLRSFFCALHCGTLEWRPVNDTPDAWNPAQILVMYLSGFFLSCAPDS